MIPDGVMGAVQAVRKLREVDKNVSDKIRGVVSDTLLYDKEKDRVLPSSPYWDVSDAYKIQDPKQRQDAMGNVITDLGLNMAGSVVANGSIMGAAQAAPKMSVSRTVPTKLLDLGDDFQTALERVSQGHTSKSKLPILAVPNEKGLFSVRDGNHRLADLMRKGGKDVEIITDEQAYRKLAELEDQFINGGKPRFIKDAQGRFAGSAPSSALGKNKDVLQTTDLGVQDMVRSNKVDPTIQGAIKKLYHGGDKIDEINLNKSRFDKTFYMSDNADYAKSYGGNKSVLNEIDLSPDAKLADLRKPSDDLLSQIKKEISGKLTGKMVKVQRPDGTYLEIPEVKGGASNPVYTNEDIIQGIKDGKAHYAELPEVKAALRKLGYDGQITGESEFGANYGVWNKDVVKVSNKQSDVVQGAMRQTQKIPQEFQPSAEILSKMPDVKSVEYVKNPSYINKKSSITASPGLVLKTNDGNEILVQMGVVDTPFGKTMNIVGLEAKNKGTGSGTKLMNYLKSVTDESVASGKRMDLNITMASDSKRGGKQFYQKFPFLEDRNDGLSFRYSPNKPSVNPVAQTAGQVQVNMQSPDLTTYERAMNSGDMGLAEQLSRKYPGDARFAVHKRFMGL